MNFLAHLYLSQHPPELMVGNFIGDFVKGKAHEDYPEMIQKGIILHREIDYFTDDNKFVKQSKKRLFPSYRHYSAVIVDMFYDHFLASQWHNYHHQPLKEFAEECYATINSFREVLPEQVLFMFSYMVKQDWLKSYENISGIDKALSGLSRRSRFTSYMEHAAKDLQEHYQEYKTEFAAFFPLIIQHVENWKKENIIL